MLHQLNLGLFRVSMPTPHQQARAAAGARHAAQLPVGPARTRGVHCTLQLVHIYTNVYV